ncbi:H nucleoside cotransporter, partial [Rhizoctonia solani]
MNQPGLYEIAGVEPEGKRNSVTDEKRDLEVESGSISHDKHHDVKHVIAHDNDEAERKREERRARYAKYRPYILTGVALVILGWWISSTVLEATRHRWIVQTFWAWFFILIIAFRFIPNSVVTRPVEAVWQPLISGPFFAISYRVRLAMGWLALLGIVFGSAFGFPLPEGTGYGDRAISVFGLFVFTCGFWLSSKHRSQVPWPTVIVGLFMQQAIALFVLKTDAGFKIFLWVAQLAADFLDQAGPAAGFFFDPEVTAKHWFFVNTLGAIIFFIAFVQMLYYLGVMQWLIKQFAWFFFKTMNVSGAEAVVAAASPWIGQGESACLVRPFVDLMTESEIHLSMTSGFSTIAGSVFAAYVGMGVPGQNLVTSSVMSIPASIAISKLRIPETEEPITRGQVIIDQGAEDKHGRPANALHAFSKGALFGLIVAGQILCNVLTVLALVYVIDGLLTWVGKGFGIHHLTLDLIFGYLFYPITFLIGVPRNELLRVARLLATKLVANEFVAYQALKDQDALNPFSERGYTIASYGLCGFANLALGRRMTELVRPSTRLELGRARSGIFGAGLQLPRRRSYFPIHPPRSSSSRLSLNTDAHTLTHPPTQVRLESKSASYPRSLRREEKLSPASHRAP